MRSIFNLAIISSMAATSAMAKPDDVQFIPLRGDETTLSAENSDAKDFKDKGVEAITPSAQSVR